jgi:hypothetical protein
VFAGAIGIEHDVQNEESVNDDIHSFLVARLIRPFDGLNTTQIAFLLHTRAQFVGFVFGTGMAPGGPWARSDLTVTSPVSPSRVQLPSHWTYV